MTQNNAPKIYIETYGCQMNVSDSEVVIAIMQKEGYRQCETPEEADLILINTCSIRDNAEQRAWGRLKELRALKRQTPTLILGVIGCMAERLKEQLVEKEQSVDLVVGPDAYRELPNLIRLAQSGQKGVNVELSREETYAEIAPVRYESNGVSAYVSIMRGCNNMCSYCVVPYTRGGERSRSAQSIINEVKQAVAQGYKEITLLGQNVNSYHYPAESAGEISFALLLEQVAQISPQLRVRFSTSHPKDMGDDVLHTMAKYDNICKSIHLPAQSGSNRILKLMNRSYTHEQYLERIAAIRRILPTCSISTDLIAGFCSETEQDHQQTLDLIRKVKYSFAFMFMYSERPNTYAMRHLKDDVPEEVKIRRLNEIITLQRELAQEVKQTYIGKSVEVLVEGVSKKSSQQLFGRTSQNQVVIFNANQHKIGDYLTVTPTDCTSATLIAT
ncbi:MAG: tRNA (N6-isopentenyl adenosine(37)-C2)-methylthiotransferase MiaB [Bacteroidales bacterium]